MDIYSHTTELTSGQELSLKFVSISPLIAKAQRTAANINVKTKGNNDLEFLSLLLELGYFKGWMGLFHHPALEAAHGKEDLTELALKT